MKSGKERKEQKGAGEAGGKQEEVGGKPEGAGGKPEGAARYRKVQGGEGRLGRPREYGPGGRRLAGGLPPAAGPAAANARHRWSLAVKSPAGTARLCAGRRQHTKSRGVPAFFKGLLQNQPICSGPFSYARKGADRFDRAEKGECSIMRRFPGKRRGKQRGCPAAQRISNRILIKRRVF